MNEIRVKIEDPKHLYYMAHASGMMDAQEQLENLPQGLRQTPGVALAIATIGAEANALRGQMIGKNHAAIARAGHDVARYKTVTFDPNTAELVCDFYDPDLFDSDQSS